MVKDTNQKLSDSVRAKAVSELNEAKVKVLAETYKKKLKEIDDAESIVRTLKRELEELEYEIDHL